MMKSVFLTIVYLSLALCLLLTIWFGYEWCLRYGLDYNEMGNYYDVDSGINYQEDSAMIYPYLTILGLVLSFVLFQTARAWDKD